MAFKLLTTKTSSSKTPAPASSGSIRRSRSMGASSSSALSLSAVSADSSSGWMFMYKELPPESLTLTINEMEDAAYERIKLLRSIKEYEEAERLTAPSSSASSLEENSSHSNSRERDLSKLYNHIRQLRSPLMQDEDSNDAVSHFILRLAFCKNDESRKWLLNTECLLYRCRLDDLFVKMNSGGRGAFLDLCRDNGVECEEADLEPEIMMAARAWTKLTFFGSGSDWQGQLFAFPFTAVPELVARRQVYLYRGQAFVPLKYVVDILVAQFRTRLSQSLALCYRARPVLAQAESDRVMPILEDIAACAAHVGRDYTRSATSSAEKLCLPDLEDMHLSVPKQSFPPCMLHIHRTLKDKHHLKHGARQQYGLFLKGCGLPMDDAITFWRTEFTKDGPERVTDEQFKRRYEYNIRHNYGREGKRTDYTPYACAKIIGTGPSSGDCNGCPFKHHDEYSLKQLLVKEYNIPSAQLSEILELTRGQHYQGACRNVWVANHPDAPEPAMIIQHPNEFWDLSVKFLRGEGKEGEKKSAYISSKQPAAKVEKKEPVPPQSSNGDHAMDDELTPEEEEMMRKLEAQAGQSKPAAASSSSMDIDQ